MKIHLELPMINGESVCNTASARFFTYDVTKVSCKRCLNAVASADNKSSYKSQLELAAVRKDVVEKALYNTSLTPGQIREVMDQIRVEASRKVLD